MFEGTHALRVEHYGTTHPFTLQHRLIYGRALGTHGQLARAKALVEEVSKHRLQQNGLTSWQYSNTLFLLAEIELGLSEFEAGFDHLLKTIAIVEGLPNREIEVADRCAYLAQEYGGRGRHEEAHAMAEKALAFGAKATTASNERQAKLKVDVGVYYLRAGNLEKAEPLFDQVRKEKDSGKPLSLDGYAYLLFQTAVLHMRQGEFEEAEELMQEARSIHIRSGGENCTGAAQMLWEIGYLRIDQGRGPEALAYFEQAIDSLEVVFGSNHPVHSSRLAVVGALCEQNGWLDKAASYYLRSVQGLDQFLQSNLGVLPENERFELLSRHRESESMLRCLVQLPEADLAPGFAAYLSWKGKATRLQAASLKLLQSAENQGIQDLRGRLIEINQELSELVLKTLSSSDSESVDKLRTLREERLLLERAIAVDLGLDTLFLTPEEEELQQSLPQGSVLLDFYVGVSVFVWVVHPQGKIQLLDLGSALEMEEEQRRFLKDQGLRGGRTLTPSNPRDSDLLKMLWQPIAPHLADATTVFVSPDGFLNELAFGILPAAKDADGTQRYLIESHQFNYLSDATRLTEAFIQNPKREGSVFGVGGVNYFKRAEEVELKSGLDTHRSRIGGTWAPLDGTRAEVESLRAMIQYVLEWKTTVTILQGETATEGRVRSGMPGHRYLHLATHGYFEPEHLPSFAANAESLEAKARLGEKIEATGMLPGLLAGLVFAGANREPKVGEDDGFMSAEEISYLDLSACDLAVLSACQTALGSRRAGEGLMSLRRAFDVAGAQSVVSSLWTVDDRASADLMASFYKNFLQSGMGKGEALHQAKLQMLKGNRADYQGDARPRTWGAFVLSGNWN
ncbi:MAG: CHAT domain-containing protein [Planctomycetes bacterium]|nr:CHAT domain-containing protein [Planctomycetota bacterium]